MVIGSVKSNMGHAEGASGLMGVVKILLMIEDKCLYPNHGFKKSPHAHINDGTFQILKSSKDNWKPGACSISSFGFGGTNAFAILIPSTSFKSVSFTTPQTQSQHR
jgi:acyl transferase domain-containing protein